MKIVKKKKPKLLLIMAISLVVLTAAAIIFAIVLKSEDNPKAPPEIIDGEAIYNGSALAYEHISQAEMTYINIAGSDGEYWLRREELEDGTRGDFILFYRDGNGDEQIYYPDIFAYDPNFEYSDLYATVPFGDYGNVPKLTYLCVAIGTAYFDERIEVTPYIEMQDEELRWYGLASDDKTVTVTLKYQKAKLDESGNAVKDDKGKTVYESVTRQVKIGERLVTGGGYYFMVDGRNYVYSTRNNYFDYAMTGFVDFINPVLTAAGLPQDSAFEPYLTTGYEQYKNTVHKEGSITSGSTVIIDADVITPLFEYSEQRYPDGYDKTGTVATSVNLTDAAKSSIYKALADFLTGKSVGAFGAAASITMPDYNIRVDLSETGSVTKYYRITAVEAVLKDGAEADITADGEGAGEGNLLRVTYYLMNSEGRYESGLAQHGVIDVSSHLLDDETKAKLSALPVGKLASGEFVEFSITYTEQNAVNRTVEMYIDEIVEILDSDGKNMTKVKVGSTVVYHYYVVIDGVKVDDELVDRLVITDDLTGEAADIADAVMGREIGDIAKPVRAVNYVGQYDVMADFVIYEISGVKWFVTRDKIVSFKFQQSSERDPYYGESLYVNTTGNEYNLYALNATACEKVVALFGGAGKNTSSTSGLIGIETVAVGLTPEVMEHYKLYANTVYFEVPRGITSIQYDSEKETVEEYLGKLDDYSWYTTLGFTLYISNEEDGYRYIACDLYDLVAKVKADEFAFLDMSFVDFYARRNLVLTNVSNIKTLTVELMMKDLYGTYVNELTHVPLLAYNGKLYTEATLPEEALDHEVTDHDGIQVFVMPKGAHTTNKLIEYIEERGYADGVSLYELYGKKNDGVDTLGTSCFKEFIEVLFYTFYSGSIPKTAEGGSASQEYVLANFSPIMRMKVALGVPHSDPKKAAEGIHEYRDVYDYVYEFYKYSDNEVLVRVYRQNRDSGTIRVGEVSDFYISNFAFKKLVSAYCALLNGERLNNDLPFVSEGEAVAVLSFGKEEA